MERKPRLVGGSLLETPIGVAFLVCINVVSTVGLVFANKLVMDSLRFPYSTTFLLLHLLGNTAFTAVHKMCFQAQTPQQRVAFDQATEQTLSWRDVFPLTIMFVLSVVSMNLSLFYNSVGFYQITKVLMTPILAAVESCYMKRHLSIGVQISLLMICIGTALVTVSDVHVSFAGICIAFMALLFTVTYQIYTSIRVKQLNADTNQIMHLMAPQACLIILFFIPITDKKWPHEIFMQVVFDGLPKETLIFVLVTCIFSVGVNLTSFNLVVYTSPLTFQVISQLKTTVIVLGGVLLFDESISMQNGYGITLVLLSAFLYIYMKGHKEQASHDQKSYALIPANNADSNNHNTKEVC